MKTAIDKNESELEKMKRESLEWIEKQKYAPPFISVAVNAFQSSPAITKENDKQQELSSIIHEVIWQYCFGKGDADALFKYQDIGDATKEIVDLYFQPELSAQAYSESRGEMSNNEIDEQFPIKSETTALTSAYILTNINCRIGAKWYRDRNK